MKKIISTALLLISSLAYGDTTDDAVLSGIRAYQAAKCLAYLEVAGATEEPSYNAIAKVYFKDVKVYVENALSDDFKEKAIGKNIPMTWFGFVYSNRLGSDVLSGRLLQWTNMIETQRVGNLYAPDEQTIPERAGVAAFNNENCILLIK